MKFDLRKLLFAFLTFLSFLIYSKIIFSDRSYNILLFILFIAIYYFYCRFDYNCSKRSKTFAFATSIFISLLLSLGSVVSSYIYEPAVNIFTLKNILYFVICYFGLIIFFNYLFKILFSNLNKVEIFEDSRDSSKKVFFRYFLIILVGYLLYFVRFFPAIMTPDSYYVLHYANNFILSDFHPFVHTWFVGIFFHLGKYLFGDLTLAVGFTTFVQMSLLALIFSYGVYYFYKKGLNKKICLFLVLFFALHPLHAHYSITLWRDILFGGSFVIIFISLIEFLDSTKKISKKYVFLFMVGIMVLLFFRNNGIYIYLFMIPFLIGILKNNRIFISSLCFSILIFYFVIKGPVFNYFNIKKTTSVEAYSVPLQQISRVIASGRDISNEDTKYLIKLFSNYDSINEIYNPVISDPIKNITSNDVLSEDKINFFKVWFNNFIKYPNVYVEAYFLQTLGYWYPDVIYWATAGESTHIFDEEKVDTKPLTPSWYNSIIDLTISRNLPLCDILWSVALPFLLICISSFMLCYMKKYKYLLCFVPLFGLWLSIMVATPVFCELRYVYGLFTCLPFCLILPCFVHEKNE